MPQVPSPPKPELRSDPLVPQSTEEIAGAGAPGGDDRWGGGGGAGSWGVQGLGLKVQGLGLKVPGVGFKV